MKIQHFQNINPDFYSVTIETAEICCPYCKQLIRMIVPDDSSLLDYKEETKFLRGQNDQLRREIFQNREIIRTIISK